MQHKEPAGPTEGSGGWWLVGWCGPCQRPAAVVILRRFNANAAVVRRGVLGLWLPVPNPSLKEGDEKGEGWLAFMGKQK